MNSQVGDVEQSKVVIKQGKNTTDFFDADLAGACRELRTLKQDVETLKPSMEQYKTVLIEKAKQHLNGMGTIRFIVDGRALKITIGYECVIAPEHLAEVKDLLGERFVDLVRMKTSYTGTQTLIDLASDADTKHPVRKFLTIKEKAPELKFEE